MILIDPTNMAISDLYGDEAYQELHAFMRKLRLDRSALKMEGNPVLEHLIIPESKMSGGIVTSQARLATRKEVTDVRDRKAARVKQATAARKADLERPKIVDTTQEDADTYRRNDGKRRRG